MNNKRSLEPRWNAPPDSGRILSLAQSTQGTISSNGCRIASAAGRNDWQAVYFGLPIQSIPINNTVAVKYFDEFNRPSRLRDDYSVPIIQYG